MRGCVSMHGSGPKRCWYRCLPCSPAVPCRAVPLQFIRQNIYYAARLDLAHASDLTKPTTTIDFAIDPASFVSKHKLLGLGLEVPGYGNVLRDVINSGLFFRSPLNRVRARVRAGGPACVPSLVPLHC